MLQLQRPTIVATVAFILLFSLGCSSSHSPVAPSTSTLNTATPGAPSSPIAGTSTVSGTLSAGPAAASIGPRGAAAGVTVSISGTSLSTVADASGVFTFTNVPAMEIVLKFEGAGVNATLSIGTLRPQERIEITVTVSGTSATLDANQRTGSDNVVQAEGKITDLDATPQRLLLASTVVEAAGATIHRGDGTPMSFADLRRGDRIHVRGTRTGNTIVATEITDQNAAQPPVTLSGTVAAVGGACPSVTLTVGGVSGLSVGTRNNTVTVSTTASTAWPTKPCGDARAGDPVVITAQRQADDSLVATNVDARNPPPVQISGVVSSVSGSCPQITLALGSVSGASVGASNATASVRSTAATTWPTKACADVKSGDTAAITAVRQPDGTYLASTVDAKSPPTVAVTFSGTIASLSGSCPVVTLSMSGVSGLSIGTRTYAAVVETNTATIFTGSACGAVKANDTATIVAVKQANGVYLASTIDAKPRVDAPATTITFTGTIAGVGGSCPVLALSMTGVSGLSVGTLTYSATVETNTATFFATKTCGAVKAGDIATIVATKQASGVYLASKVDAKTATATFTGTIGSVSGTCPALTIAMSGVSGLASLAVAPETYAATVVTDSSTTFTASCAAVVAGKTAAVNATKQTDGKYLASAVQVK